jgi:hypothetical protein
MSNSDDILHYNGICSKCHTQTSNTHVCIDENIICTRFYTHAELIERANNRKVAYVYIKKRVTTTRPQTR